MKIDRLTSIRGIAALHVIVYHCQELVGGFNLRPWTNLVEKGYLAVDFFFLLSGFILAYVHAERFDRGDGRFREFLGLRLARIYPVHLVTLLIVAATVLILWGFNEGDQVVNRPWTFAGNVLLVQAWGFNRKMSWNFQAWSISAEWFVYLAFPVLLMITRPFAGRPGVAIACAISCIAALGGIAVALLPPGVSVAGATFANTALPSRPFDIVARYALLRVTLEFTAGLLLYRAFAEVKAQGARWSNLASCGTAAGLLLVMHTHLPPAIQDPLAVIATGLLIVSLAAGQSLLGRVLEHRVAVYVGEASYSIYMVHGFFIYLYVRNLEKVWLPPTTTLTGGVVVALSIVGLSMLAGSAMYHGIEVPARTRLRRWIERPSIDQRQITAIA